MIYLGDNQPTIYLGDSTPNIYLGDNQIYPTGPFEGIKVNKKKTFGRLKMADTIKLISTEPWTLSTDADWLIIDTVTGDSTSGINISVSAITQSAYTEAIISATTANYHSYCLCMFKVREIVPPNDTIMYISNDGLAHDPSRPASWFAGTDGRALNSFTNTYSGGYGSIVFDRDLGVLAGNAFSNQQYFNTMWFPDSLTRATDESFNGVNDMILYYGTGLTTVDKLAFPKNGKLYFYANTCPTINAGSFSPWSRASESTYGELHYPWNADYSALINLMPQAWTAFNDIVE